MYLFTQSASKRGPSFRMHSSKLKAARCDNLLQLSTRPTSGAQFSRQIAVDSATPLKELYIPAPRFKASEDAYWFHVTTRNFFAWIAQRPIVGQHLGEALARLLERMQAWRDRDVNSVEAILMYADQMAYSSVVNSPDHALAMISFAEISHLKSVWIDAFAHCVGMSGDLSRSKEYSVRISNPFSLTRTKTDISKRLSDNTRTLITQGRTDADEHFERSQRSLETFLEDELSPSRFGISEIAREHLDSLRTSLQSYYVAKFGYWPPASCTKYPKDLYCAMHTEFQELYNFLADKKSSDESQNFVAARGGICVLQNIDSFNDRYGYISLPYSLPLLPATPKRKISGQKSLIALRLKSENSKEKESEKLSGSLEEATNRSAPSVKRGPLISRFMTFEKQSAVRYSTRISPGEARKVYFILIYGIVQTLSSILSAPAEVRDPDTPYYFLCVRIPGTSPWENEAATDQIKTGEQQETSSVSTGSSVQRCSSPTISIRPDCAMIDYFGYLPKRSKSQISVADDDSRSMSSSGSPRDSARAGFGALRKAKSKKSAPLKSSRRSWSFFGAEKPPLTGLEGNDQVATSSPISPILENQQEPNPFPVEERHGHHHRLSSKISEASTTVDVELLIPHQSRTDSQSEGSARSSVPSLSYSQSSSELVTPVYGGENPFDFEPANVAAMSSQRACSLRRGRRASRTSYISTLASTSEQVTLQGAGSRKRISAQELPGSVTLGYGLWSDDDNEGEFNWTGPGLVDRSVAICHDGNLDMDVVNSYVGVAQ